MSYFAEKKYYKEEEFVEFLGSLSQGQFGELRNFFDTMPKLSQEINYPCPKCGDKQKVVLEGLQNFFG